MWRVREAAIQGGAGQGDRPVVVSVSNNGVDFATRGEGVEEENEEELALLYTYREDVVITALQPRSGDMGGGTAVLVHGYNYVDSGTIVCRFGLFRPVTAQPAPPETEPLWSSSVFAHYLSATEIRCEAPPLPATARSPVDAVDAMHASPVTSPVTVVLHVAVNGIDFAPSAAAYTYVA